MAKAVEIIKQRKIHMRLRERNFPEGVRMPGKKRAAQQEMEKDAGKSEHNKYLRI